MTNVQNHFIKSFQFPEEQIQMFRRKYRCHLNFFNYKYRSAENSLARPSRKQARKHVRDARDFSSIEKRAVIKFFFFLQGKAPKEIHAILTETLACFLPGWAKDLSAALH